MESLAGCHERLDKQVRVWFLLRHSASVVFNGQDSAGVRQALPLSYAKTERAWRRPVEEASSYAQYDKLCYNFNHSTGDREMRVYLPFIDCERKKPIALRMRIVSRHGDWRKVQLYRNPTDEIIVHSRNLYDNFMSAYKSAKRSFKRFRSSDRNRYVLTYAKREQNSRSMSRGDCSRCKKEERTSCTHTTNE